jgi:hypothetical protein
VIFPPPPALTWHLPLGQENCGGSAMKKFLGVTFLLGIVAGAYWSLKNGSPDRGRRLTEG